MAICLSFMVGRFGGVAGSNLSAILFADYCASAFYVPGLALIGKLTFYCTSDWFIMIAILLYPIAYFYRVWHSLILHSKHPSSNPNNKTMTIVNDDVRVCMCIKFITINYHMTTVVIRTLFVITNVIIVLKLYVCIQYTHTHSHTRIHIQNCE